jgi:hypothetical protein
MLLPIQILFRESILSTVKWLLNLSIARQWSFAENKNYLSLNQDGSFTDYPSYVNNSSSFLFMEYWFVFTIGGLAWGKPSIIYLIPQ